jgi:preprotein translocase subunit YajC
MPKNLVPLIYLALLVFAFYFLMIRPQRQRMRRTDAMQSQIDVGDEVMLTSGIFGTVAAIDDDGIQVTVADGVQIRVDKRAIGTVTKRDVTDPDAGEFDEPAPDEPAPGENPIARDLSGGEMIEDGRPSTEFDRPDRGAS